MHIVIAFLVAAAPLAGEKIQREAEDRARADVVDLLRTLCPEQCVLLSVRAQMDEEQIAGDPSPGFDAPGARTIPVVRALNANIVVDQRLPMQFRTRLKSLIANRLKTAGAPVEVDYQASWIDGIGAKAVFPQMFERARQYAVTVISVDELLGLCRQHAKAPLGLDDYRSLFTHGGRVERKPSTSGPRTSSG